MQDITLPGQETAPAFSYQAVDAPKDTLQIPRLRLLHLPAADEPRLVSNLYFVLAMAISAAFFMLVRVYFAPGPGNPGIDENAYLVGGKNIARHFTPGFKPATDYAYVGPMWIRTSDGWYYPKYPSGTPLLNAIAIWLGGGHDNAVAFYTSPVCATLSVLAMFLLTRAIAGSFFALLATLVLATNSIMLQLALVPSSHAPALCFVLWGVFAFISWWRTGAVWIGIIAGLLLGYAVTIRYTEGLLLLPMGLAALTMLRWRNWRSYLHAAIPMLAWLVPVGTLLLFNHHATGHWTGYDSTHESTGFTIAEFKSKWEYTIQELYLYGMFFLMPIGILGMLMMFARNWRIASFLVLWFVPSVILYTAYYWGQQTPGVGYLRFFLTLFPPIVASAMWLMATAASGLDFARDPRPPASLRRGRIAAPIGAGVFTAMIAAVGVYVSASDLERQHLNNENLAFSGKALIAAVPQARHESGKRSPIFFVDDSGMFSRVLMYLQFAGDGDWYSASAFTSRGSRGFMGWMSRRQPGNGANDPDQSNPAPVLIQPERVTFMEQVYSKLTQTDLRHEEARVIGAALDAEQGVYAILSPRSAEDFRRRMNTAGFDCKTVTIWKEPVTPALEAVGEPPKDAADSTQARPGGGRQGGPGGGGPGGGGPGRFGPGAFSTGGLAPPMRGMMRDAGGLTFQVVQVVHRAAPHGTTLPTTGPATR